MHIRINLRDAAFREVSSATHSPCRPMYMQLGCKHHAPFIGEIFSCRERLVNPNTYHYSEMKAKNRWSILSPFIVLRFTYVLLNERETKKKFINIIVTIIYIYILFLYFYNKFAIFYLIYFTFYLI